MKKQLLAMAVASLAVSISSQVFAQSKFEGAYGQIGVGYESINPSISSIQSVRSSTGVAYPYTTSINSSSGFNGAITAGYNFAITKEYLLGIGVDYSPLQSASNSYTYTNATLGTVNGNSKKQNAYTVFLSPGYAIDQDKLIYAKVGYTGAYVKDTDNSTVPNRSNNYTGYALGFGYKQIISGGFYGFGEANYLSYNEKTSTTNDGTYVTTSKSSSNVFNLLVGVGYKF